MNDAARKGIIELEGVSKIYDLGEVKVRALDSLTLSIFPAELTVILGPSGSGKTTLLNIIGGIDHATEGKVVVNGVVITGMNERELTAYRREAIGFIFQFFNLIPNLTALENVEFVVDYIVEKRRRKDIDPLALLERVGLGARADHFPYQLSGGEQQRVCIARGLAKDPPIVLADEPTGELDHHTGMEVLELLRSLIDEGKTVIVVTHDREIADVADQVVELMDGRVKEIRRR
jgi:putative ABC transport system ATP-binding protein